MNKGLGPASCEAAREQLAQNCGQLLRDTSASFDLASAADAARSADRDAAERQRLRDLANAEMDRLWRLKHGGR